MTVPLQGCDIGRLSRSLIPRVYPRILLAPRVPLVYSHRAPIEISPVGIESHMPRDKKMLETAKLLVSCV